jgi:predicted amidohydrolase
LFALKGVPWLCVLWQMEFCGSSAIIAPDGSEAVRAGRSHDALLVARLDPSQYDEYKARNPYLTDRRPELYSAIAARHPCRKEA